MNKKILVFLLVVIGLGGVVWWQSNPNGGSPEERFARAIKLMEGLQSRAIPIEFTNDQTELLEGVYQDSIVRLPNIQGFRNTDKTKLITTLSTVGFSGTGANGLNVPGESIVTLSLTRTDDFNAGIDSSITALGTTTQVVKDEIKRLAQSVNTLTNDIRLTLLYMSWYETLRPTLCTTNDPNNDIYISGEVRFRYLYTTSPTTPAQPLLKDSCETTGASVKQYKCLNGQYTADAAHTSVTACPEGCSNGACLRTNQSGFMINTPGDVTVGTPFNITIRALDANGATNPNYTGTFFIIIAGDDDAVFPTGGLNIMSGEVSKGASITFSKTGNMLLTVRGQDGLESSTGIRVNPAGTVSCNDSDGGKNAYVKGTTVGAFTPQDTTPGSQTDVCYLAGSLVNNDPNYPQGGHTADSCAAGTLCYVAENSCIQSIDNSGKTVIGLDNIPCPNGCNNGACITPPTTTTTASCTGLSVASTLTNGGNVTFSCTGNNVTSYSVVVKKPDNTILSTFSSSTGIAAIPATPTGTYKVECFVNGQTTTSTACEKTITNQAPTITSCVGTLPSHASIINQYSSARPSDNQWTYYGLTAINPTTQGCIYECENGYVYSYTAQNGVSCIPQTVTVPSCTGTLPTNATILSNVGTTSRAWTYDGSSSGPYQNCSFKCNVGYLYTNNTCTATQITIGTTGTTAIIPPATTTTTTGTTSGTATSGTTTTTSGSTTSSTGSTTSTTTSGTGTTTAPTITSISPATAHTGDSMVFTINGSGFAPANSILIRDPNGNTSSVTTGVFGDPSDGHFIYVNSASGYMLPGIYSIQVESGSSGHPRSNTVTITVSAPPNTVTGPVSISEVKDCWFGDTTRRITLADFIGYQATPSTNSGLIYMDEVLLYGATAPGANTQMTNIFSYEESEWIAGEDTVATSTPLTNFFAFRTNSPGTRTWNMPTSGIKFYGCFSRDDRPTTW